MIKVSVLIPTYNRAELIVESLESVFDQTFSDYEIIVIDDGSTDNSKMILASLIESNKIRYIYQKNAGAAAARNTGIKHARGKYVAFLDSDDLYYPDKLLKQVKFLDNHPEAYIVHSDFSKFDNLGNDLGVRDTSYFSGWIYPHILLHWSMLMAIPCVMVKRNIFEQIGLFDESLTYSEDLDLWARIAMKFPFHRIPIPLVRIRDHKQSISSNRSTAQNSIIYLEKAFVRDPGLGKHFRNRSVAKMYAYIGLNLLGNGSKEQMKNVRRLVKSSLIHWPFEPSAWLGILGSLLSPRTRLTLVKWWRKYRYYSA